MIGYTTIGVKDLKKSEEYYTKLANLLGSKKMFGSDRIVFFGNNGFVGGFSICLPYDGEAASTGNGTMVAFNAPDHATVDKAYDLAISMGSTDEGAPGLRGDKFYGAYFRDLDGNKICVFNY